MKATKYYRGKSGSCIDCFEELALGEDGHWWSRLVRYAGASMRTRTIWAWTLAPAPPLPATKRARHVTHAFGYEVRYVRLTKKEAEGCMQGGDGPLRDRSSELASVRLPNTPEWMAIKAAMREAKKIGAELCVPKPTEKAKRPRGGAI